MAVTIPNSPIHEQAMITYPYGVADSGYTCGWHTGLDFDSTVSASPLLYSVCSGTVTKVTTSTSTALGVQAYIKDDETGLYWHYCHMQAGSLRVKVSDKVNTGSPIGILGSTGNVTGAHLHLELMTSMVWACSNFRNPAEYLHIPNIDGEIVNYDGSAPEPPTPGPPVSRGTRKGFPWRIFGQLIQKRRRL